jgi:hypothetical protein
MPFKLGANTINLLYLTNKSFKKIKFGRILQNLRSNLIEFDHKGKIQQNSTFEFRFQNSKNRNSKEFVRAYFLSFQPFFSAE